MALEIEKLFSKKLEKMKKTTICHCRTTIISNELKFEWTLKNFLIPTKSSITSKVTGITRYFQAFTVNVSFDVDENMIYFHTWFMAEKKNIKANYYIYTDIKGKKLYPCEVNGIYLTQNMRVYEISFYKIEKDVSFDPEHDSLTVYFRFDVIESVSNHFFQTIIDESEESAIDKFALDKRSGVKVHFLLGEKYLSIDKALLYSKSDHFKDMFDEPSGRSINATRLYFISYDIFKHLIYYLETGSLDKLIVSKGGNLHDVYARMEIRLFLDTKYDKIRETLHMLLLLGISYDIKDLVLLCEKLLIKTMHRVDVEKEMSFGHFHDVQTVKKYALKFLKLHCYNMNYFKDYKKLYTQLIKENFNCHKMSFITEEYDPDTFNVKS